MTDFWLAVAGEIPALAIILLFLIYERRNQSASIERNHQLWQQWLEKRDAAASDERRAWQDWIHERDRIRNEENRELIATLSSLQAEMRSMSNIILVRYAVGDGKAKEVLEALEKAKEPDKP